MEPEQEMICIGFNLIKKSILLEFIVIWKKTKEVGVYSLISTLMVKLKIHTLMEDSVLRNYLKIPRIMLMIILDNMDFLL
jgi:hypothetical protein